MNVCRLPALWRRQPPSPGQLIGLGGCCLNFYCLGLSRNVQLCYCLSNSQISPHYQYLHQYYIIFTTSDSPSKTILKPYAMKLCLQLYVTALKCIVKCHKDLCLQCLCARYIIHSVLELRLIGKNNHKNRKPFPAAAVGFKLLHCGVHRGRIALFYLNYRLQLVNILPDELLKPAATEPTIIALLLLYCFCYYLLLIRPSNVLFIVPISFRAPLRPSATHSVQAKD